MGGCDPFDWLLKVQLPLFFMDWQMILNSEHDKVKLILISYQYRIARHFLDVSNFQIISF